MSGSMLSAQQRQQLDRLLAERMPTRPPTAISRWAGDRSAMPLSYAQQRIWFFTQLEPSSALYNVVGTARLTGPLDLELVQAALDEIVRRHEVVRTNYSLAGGEPVQAVRPPTPLPVTVIDLSAVHPADRDAEIAARCQREATRPFDLERDPMLRPVFLRLAAQDHLLLLSQHHIAADGWSLGVLLSEFGLLYRAFQRGEPSPLPEPALQYGDFAQWQRDSLPILLDGQLDYWRANLAGARPLDLPGDQLLPPSRGWAGGSVRFWYPRDFVADVRRLGEQSRSTLFMVLLAAFGVVAARWSEQSDFVVGTPIANRNEPEIEAMLGCFVNTLPLRLAPDPAGTFQQFLSAVRTTCLNGYANQDVPFERIVEAVKPERDARSRTPLVRHMFGLHNTARPPLELPGLQVELGTVSTGMVRFDLELEFTPGEDGDLGGELRYASDLFSAALAARIVDGVRTVLATAISDPAAPIGGYPLITPSERRRVTETFLPAESLAAGSPAGGSLDGGSLDGGSLDGGSPAGGDLALARWTAALGPATEQDVLLSDTPGLDEAAALGWRLRGQAGGATMLPAGAGPGLNGLLELIESAGITGCLLGSGQLDELARDPDAIRRLAGSSLRQVICPDRQLPGQLAGRLVESLPGIALHSAYLPAGEPGPVAAVRLTGGADRRRVLLGPVLPGARLLLLDGGGQPVPVGVPGEVCLDEVCLDEAGGSPRRTGDRARWLPDASLEHLGPAADPGDGGGRLEDVRRALLDQPSVSQAVVVTGPDGRPAGYLSLVEPGGGIEQSRRQFLANYASRPGDRDLGAHLDGWNSPYTGDYVPAEQMRAWLDGALELIRRHRPEHVLQIGCGTGVLPAALAAECASYRAVEPSGRLVEQLRREHPEVRLYEHAADGLASSAWLADAPAPDTVLVPISQFFPDERYLRVVLAEALQLVRPGGRMLLLDVRNSALLEAMHAALLLDRLPEQTPVAELVRLATGLAEQEEELAVDPAELVAFASRLPGVTAVSVLPKLSGHANEITKFRYDVVVDTAPGAAGRPVLPVNLAAVEQAVLAAARAEAVATVGELRALRDRGLPSDLPVQPGAAQPGGALSNAPALARLARAATPRIQRRLRQQLPDSLLPSSITVVRHWPLTAGGAIDGSRLPAPLPSAAAELAARPIPPRTDTERAVAEIWTAVLEVGSVGVNQDFFALGGHSLLGTQVIDQVQTRFGVELPLARLFESSTIAAVADFVDEQLRSADRVAPIRRIDRGAARRVRTEPGDG